MREGRCRCFPLRPQAADGVDPDDPDDDDAVDDDAVDDDVRGGCTDCSSVAEQWNPSHTVHQCPRE